MFSVTGMAIGTVIRVGEDDTERQSTGQAARVGEEQHWRSARPGKNSRACYPGWPTTNSQPSAAGNGSRSHLELGGRSQLSG